MLPDGFSIAVMHNEEVQLLNDWAITEGWNPGLSDIHVARDFDFDAFIALRQNNEMIGGGTIISYAGLFGFMGLFIVRPDFRGVGLGASLWHYRRDLLKSRLEPSAAIGMDGVFTMAPFYERGGFKLAHKDLRYEGIAKGSKSSETIDLNTVPFEVVVDYDSVYFPVNRSIFLKKWLSQPGVLAFGIVEHDHLRGYGVARPCYDGYKIGPLFADSETLAKSILSRLLFEISGEKVQIDVPEPNAGAIKLAVEFGLSEAFGCARMYLGATPNSSLKNIFSVTSFEFG